jgi:hypothetical protein
MGYNWDELEVDGAKLKVARAYGDGKPDRASTLSLVRRAREIFPDLPQLVPDYASNGSRVLLNGGQDMEMVTPANCVVRMKLKDSPGRDFPLRDIVEVYSPRVETDPLYISLDITIHGERRTDLMERASRETYAGTNKQLGMRLRDY